MQALCYENNCLQLFDKPKPLADQEVLVKVLLAGMCRTDLELVKGYMGFSGTLGHEFVGEVVYAADPLLQGKRAVFIEFLAAACRIAEQVAVGNQKILVIGDGKPGLLIAQVLQLLGGKVSCQGKHVDKLALLKKTGVRTLLLGSQQSFDIVVKGF